VAARLAEFFNGLQGYSFAGKIDKGFVKVGRPPTGCATIASHPDLWHRASMRFVIEELGADGSTVVRRSSFDAHLRFEVGPNAPREQRFALPSPLVVIPDADDERAACWYETHTRDLLPVRPLLFTLPQIRLRLSLISASNAASLGVSGGKGRCPKCSSSLQQRAVGGAYRSFARDVRACGVCHVEVVELDEAGETLGQFSDVTENDWYWVAAPHRCPSCGDLMRRSRLRTRHGEADVERCVPCALLVLDDEDRSRLLDRD
jgi:hypothetical protein